MKVKIVYFYVALIIAAMYGCQEEDNVETRYKVLNNVGKEFAEKFEDRYGVPSSEISWMTATDATVSLDLSRLPSGTYDIRFYTSDPTEESSVCYLLAEYDRIAPDKEHLFNVDYPTGLGIIYAAVIGADGHAYVEQISTESLSVIVKESESSGIVDHPVMRYIIGFDGNTEQGFDFDYNDILLYVDYVRGRPTAKITLAAAGCNCWAQVLYRREAIKKNKYIETILFEEAHEALGHPGIYNYRTGKNEYYFLNSSINETGHTAETVLDLLDDEGASICSIAPKFVSYFMIDDLNEKTATECHIPTSKGAPNPEALLIAYPKWHRMPETMSIDVVYSEFRDWVIDPSAYPFWYGNDPWVE